MQERRSLVIGIRERKSTILYLCLFLQGKTSSSTSVRVSLVRFYQHLNNKKDHAVEIFNTGLLLEDSVETETE